MVRAGRKGAALDLFLEQVRLAVGWGKNLGDPIGAPMKSVIKAQVANAYPQVSPSKVGAVTGCLHKIRIVREVGYAVVTNTPHSQTAGWCR
jgi:predicted Mrr-cat superfamily restriction endonuclease